MPISGVTSSPMSLNHFKVLQQQSVTQSQQLQQNQQNLSQNRLDPDHDGDIDSHLGRDIDLRG